MQRRSLIASLGALFVAGCAGVPSSESPSDESVDPPEPTLEFKHVGGGFVRVVHMGGENVTDAATAEVYVTAGGERVVTWVADGKTETAGSYPISVGNYVEVEAPKTTKVAVVWVGEDGTEETLATLGIDE